MDHARRRGGLCKFRVREYFLTLAAQLRFTSYQRKNTRVCVAPELKQNPITPEPVLSNLDLDTLVVKYAGRDLYKVAL
jgi:hypothetical protein